LYTIKHIQNGSERFIVLKLKKDEWRFIDHFEYNDLLNLNLGAINRMKNDLNEIMPELRANIIINRFEQQRNCIDCQGIPSQNHRLWNIQILNENVTPIIESVNELSECPDSHILTLQMFQLYNSNNFNHQNCI
jgi:hypothetical protein